MLKVLTEYSKNIREEMKFKLSEIKKNLQGTNSGADEAEKSMIKNARKEKKHSIRTAGIKKNLKK